MNRLLVAVMAVFSIGLVACENVDSEDVMTSGIYADINSTAEGNGETIVRAAMRVGGGNSNTYLELVGDDKLTASMGETSVEMGERTFLGSRWYVAEFEEDAADTEFKVAFDRSVSDPAPESTMTLPQGFEITAPDASSAFSRATDDIVLTWDPSGSEDKMIVNIEGSCIQLYHEDLGSDSGTFTIAAGTIEAKEDQDEDSCDMTLELIRHRDGDLDPAYGEGGSIWARQIRTRKFNSTQ